MDAERNRKEKEERRKEGILLFSLGTSSLLLKDLYLPLPLRNSLVFPQQHSKSLAFKNAYLEEH